MHNRLRPNGVSIGASLLAIATALAVATPSAHADGSDKIPLPVSTGCFGIRSYGIPMFGDGTGSVTVDPPGSILGVYLHWVGIDDETPPVVGESTLTVNGFDVVGIKPAPPADIATRPTNPWYSWYANIGPSGGGFPGPDLVDDANKLVDVSAWDTTSGFPATNGASVHVIYDIGPCVDPTTIEIQVGVDYYYYGFSGEENSLILVFDIPPEPIDRLVSFHVAHAGTDASQGSCRGGAIWMLAGVGAPPTDILAVAGSDRGYGINGGVEIVNDPFTSASMPCIPEVNKAPDEPYEPGHPCPGGADTCAYHALAIRPIDGGDVGAEYGVIEVDVVVPADSDFVAFQLESEADQEGESGSWSGASYVLAKLPVCGDGELDVGEECDDGNNDDGDGCSADCLIEPNQPPEIICTPCQHCNDPGLCSAEIACEDIATSCDPNGDDVELTCDPGTPYGVGTTSVVVTATDGIETTTRVCTVEVRDCEPPVCTAPLDLELECNTACGRAGSDAEIEDWLDDATGADNCPGFTLEAIAPPVFASGCGGGTTTEVVWVVEDGVGLKNVCTAGVTVADSEPPEITIIVEPVEPLPPEPPGSVCSPPTSRAFRLECEVSDGCGEVELNATLSRTWHTVDDDGMCEELSEELPLSCGDVFELEMTLPPCPPQPAGNPNSSTSSNGCGDLTAGGENYLIRVEATDGCGNLTVFEYDPAVDPSPICDIELDDGTCCPAIGAPGDPGDCDEPRCGEEPFRRPAWGWRSWFD